jgi:dihydropteroate synthase
MPDHQRVLRCGRFTLSLRRPLVMGVLNLTPDSFSDGGRYLDPRAALEHARQLAEDGADIIDIGAESTRPGAAPVPEAEEAGRVLPILKALASLDLPLSVDTRKPGVMRAVIDSGASMINDVAALRAPGAVDTVASSDVAVCLMHMQGEPQTMQVAPEYGDVVADVASFLRQRVQVCRDAGIAEDRIVIDPGFGFGKRVDHNLAMLQRLNELTALGLPLLVGLSRKATIGRLTGREPGDRLAGSLGAALSAVAHGASIVRVHDVRETVDALKVWNAAHGCADPDSNPASTPGRT